MCLAVPGKILSFQRAELAMADVQFGSIVKSVCTAYVPEAAVGDYVIVHVGFAITRLDEEAARRTLNALEQLGSLASLTSEDKPLEGTP